MKDIELKEITVTFSSESKNGARSPKNKKKNRKSGFPWGLAAVLAGIGWVVAFALGRPYLGAAFFVLFVLFGTVGLFIFENRFFNNCGRWKDWEV